MNAIELPDIAEGVVVHPGDTLVLRAVGDLTAAQANAIRRQVEAKLPPGAQVLITNASIEIAVVRKDAP